MQAVLIGGICNIIISIAAFRICIRTTSLMPIAYTWSGAWRQLQDGWHIFLSVGAIALYTQINVIMLGAVAGPVQAGLLFSAEKLKRASKTLSGPLTSAIYPRVNSLLMEDPDRAVRLMKRLLVVQGAMSFGIFVVLLASAHFLIVIFFGPDFEDAVPAMRWLSGTIFLSGLGSVLGAQVMLPFGMKRAYMRILVVSGLFNVVAIVPFSYFFGATGASISILLTEVIVTGAMGFVVWRAGILHKNEAARDL
jgi:polysaccharide transporter, PST family